MAGFRGLLELLGLWPSAPSVPPVVGCVTTTVLPVASAASADLLSATAAGSDLLAGTLTITVEGC
jgi:hypothetical protein